MGTQIGHPPPVNPTPTVVQFLREKIDEMETRNSASPSTPHMGVEVKCCSPEALNFASVIMRNGQKANVQLKL
jgi:regulation of enolase protein 1 (concanavalin A-like superfamily)